MSTFDFNAGNWRIEAWDGGYPVWVHLYRKEGDEWVEIAHCIRHSDMRDLKYVIDRMMDQLPHHRMLEGNEHELK